MSSPRQPNAGPEVDLDPASEHVARHVGTGTSTALAATQHAMQAATLRAYLARDSASAETLATQRALRAQQQLDRAAAATDSAATRAGIDLGATSAHDVGAEAGTEIGARADPGPHTPGGQWTAYHDGDPVAALGGTGVSIPPQHVLAHTDAQPVGPSHATPATPQLDQSTAVGPAATPTPTVGMDR